MADFRDAWRTALAELHKVQRRDRAKRKPAQPGPGMIRKPPPEPPDPPVVLDVPLLYLDELPPGKDPLVVQDTPRPLTEAERNRWDKRRG